MTEQKQNGFYLNVPIVARDVFFFKRTCWAVQK